MFKGVNPLTESYSEGWALAIRGAECGVQVSVQAKGKSMGARCGNAAALRVAGPMRRRYNARKGHAPATVDPWNSWGDRTWAVHTALNPSALPQPREWRYHVHAVRSRVGTPGGVSHRIAEQGARRGAPRVYPRAFAPGSALGPFTPGAFAPGSAVGPLTRPGASSVHPGGA